MNMFLNDKVRKHVEAYGKGQNQLKQCYMHWFEHSLFAMRLCAVDQHW